MNHMYEGSLTLVQLGVGVGQETGEGDMAREVSQIQLGEQEPPGVATLLHRRAALLLWKESRD